MIHASPEMTPSAQLLLDTIGPKLRELGVEHVEIVARGVPRAARYWVGYRLEPGVERSPREIHEVVSIYFPAALSYQMLRVVPASELPETDPSILEAQQRIRRPTVGMVLFFVVLIGLPLSFFLAQIVFSRGELIVTAPLRGKGSAEARFTTKGKAIALWASLDGSFSGNAGSKTLNKILPVHYEIDVIRGDQVLHHLSIDTQVGRPNQKLNCTMAPNCEIYLEDLPGLSPGHVLLKVQGTPRENVTHVRDMSINVREGTFF